MNFGGKTHKFHKKIVSSESKKEFFTKHPQVKVYLIGTFSGLDL